MNHIDFGGQESEVDDPDALDLALVKLPARLRHAFLTIGSLACARPADEIATGSADIDPPADWLPVALVPVSAPKSGKRRFSLCCGSDRQQQISFDVETAVALLHRGLLYSVPGELTNLTLSTHAVELLRSGTVTIKQVRNVKPAWNHDEMDHRWDRSIGRGGNPPKDRFGDTDIFGDGPVA